MLIAREKRKTNIIEYLLYMYQIEAIVRSFQFDINLIEKAIINNFDQPDSVKLEIRDWYESIIADLSQSSIKTKGHLPELEQLKDDLHHLHQKLLTTIQDQKYLRLYEKAKPVLEELALKSKGERLNHEIDLALHGLFGLLMLRLKKEHVTTVTQEGMEKVSAFLAQLAFYFHENEKGKFNLNKVQEN